MGELSWRGRCVRTWFVFAIAALGAFGNPEASAWRLAIVLLVLVPAMEVLVWANARSRRYSVGGIARRMGRSAGRLSRSRDD